MYKTYVDIFIKEHLHQEDFIDVSLQPQFLCCKTFTPAMKTNFILFGYLESWRFSIMMTPCFSFSSCPIILSKI